MGRLAFVWLHRWLGLTMAGFLVLVGLTGALLAFWNELNHLLTPNLYPGEHPGIELDAATLARRAEARAPQARAIQVYLGYVGTAWVTMEPKDGKKPLGFDLLCLDNVTGDELGRLQFGMFPTTLEAVMPFVYVLHDSLAAGEIGGWMLGLVALAWTIDSFVALYLTLPSKFGDSRKGFFQRWKPAWQIKWGASFFRVNFDLHRAGGLWLWGMLLVFAWSSVAMNLDGVYSRVTSFFLDYRPFDYGSRVSAADPTREPLEWEDAQKVGRRLMAEQAEKHGFEISRPIALYHLRDAHLYNYRVRSSRDIGDKYGSTGVDFDAYSGELVNVSLPTGAQSGVTVTTWLMQLHMANVFGRPYQIFVCLLGLGIALLSITGIVIWWKKHRARHGRRREHSSERIYEAR